MVTAAAQERKLIDYYLKLGAVNLYRTAFISIAFYLIYVDKYCLWSEIEQLTFK